MSTSRKRSFGSDFKRFFIRGLAILLPSVLTLWILVKAYQFVDNTIAEPINGGIRLAISNAVTHWEPLRNKFEPTEEEVQAEVEKSRSESQARISESDARSKLVRSAVDAWWNSLWAMNLIGLFVAIIAVYFAGRLLGGFLGRGIYRRVEKIITSIPGIKQIYPHIKQIVDFLLTDEKPIKFSRVVVVEYPRKGIWSVGLVTGDTMKKIEQAAGKSVTVFIPSSPTPFTGYTITVPSDEVIELPITIDEALKFTISGGVLVPPGQETKRLDSDG